MQIEVIKNPSEAQLEKLGCRSWPIWEKEPSKFPWHYDEKETCLILEGIVSVTPADNDGATVILNAGDLVIFPKGMSCTWAVWQKVQKHYKFGD